MLQANKDLAIYICGIKPSNPPTHQTQSPKKKKVKRKEEKRF